MSRCTTGIKALFLWYVTFLVFSSTRYLFILFTIINPVLITDTNLHVFSRRKIHIRITRAFAFNLLCFISTRYIWQWRNVKHEICLFLGRDFFTNYQSLHYWAVFNTEMFFIIVTLSLYPRNTRQIYEIDLKTKINILHWNWFIYIFALGNFVSKS